MDRRQVLKCVIGGTATLWASPLLPFARQGAPGTGVIRLTEKVAVLEAGNSNVVAFDAGDSLVMVDTGAPGAGDALLARLKSIAPSSRVQTVFNTHYHLDQTGNNEMFSTAGAKIIAHARTRQWMSTEYFVPDQDRYEKARPKAAWPTETFYTNGSLKAGTESVEYGHLTLAHTSGDIYVFFKGQNVLAVGDVASPLRDPALDYFTGAWIGGRVDSMDTLLKLSNDQTRIVPAYGPVMTRAEFKAERDMMEEIRVRLFKQVREGDGPKEMLEAGVLKGLARTWMNPEKFLYDAAKGLWAHHNKIDANVV